MPAVRARTTLRGLSSGRKHHGLYDGVGVGYGGLYRGSLLIAEGPLLIAHTWHGLVLRALQITLENLFMYMQENPPSWGN
jgi:hypothetical protein